MMIAPPEHRTSAGVFWQAEEIGTFSNPNPGFNPPFYIEVVLNAPSPTDADPIANPLGSGFPADAAAVGFDLTRASYIAMHPNFQDGYLQFWNRTDRRH